MNDVIDWKIFLGEGNPHDDLMGRLPESPPWRNFTWREDVLASTFQVGPGVKEVVNAAYICGVRYWSQVGLVAVNLH